MLTGLGFYNLVVHSLGPPTLGSAGVLTSLGIYSLGLYSLGQTGAPWGPMGLMDFHVPHGAP